MHILATLFNTSQSWGHAIETPNIVSVSLKNTVLNRPYGP